MHMPRVVALYRYPVKGFTPEACEVLDVLLKVESRGIEFLVSALPVQA